MPKLIEERTVKVYECSKCGARTEGSYKEALRHEAVPFDTLLPVGLVYRMFPCNEYERYGLIESEGVLDDTTHSLEDIGFDHSYIQLERSLIVSSFELEEGTTKLRIGDLDKAPRNSKGIKRELKNGNLRLLTREEFALFRMEYEDLISRENSFRVWPNELVRTSEELEALVA